MPIPSGNLVVDLDFSNPSCFTGSGLTVNDLSTSNNDFYFSGSGYTYSTVTGGEVTFDSSNTVLYRPTIQFNTYAFGTGAFSFNIWLKLISPGGLDLSQMMCMNYTGGAGTYNNFFFFANGNTSNNEITAFDGGSPALAGFGDTVVIGVWNLYSLVKPYNAGLGGVEVYLNGVPLTNSSSSTTPINLDQANSVGGQRQNRQAIAGGAHTEDTVFDAGWTIGSYQLYDVAIGASDVTNYYNSTVNRYYPPVPAALSFEINAADPACYPGTGTTVYDLSPAARVGNLDSQLGGSPTWSPSFGGIFTLDGYNDIFEFPGGGVAVSTPGSINVWFRSNQPYNTGNVASQGTFAVNGWGLSLGGPWGANPNILKFVSHANGYRSTGIGVTVGEWQFVTLNYNVDGTSDLYINGSIGTTGMASIGINAPSQYIRIGYDGGGAARPEIDVAQVYMYDGAITLAEHITLFDNTKTPFLPPTPVPVQNSNVGGRSFNKGLNG